MRSWPHILVAGLILTSAAEALADKPLYVPTRQVLLSYTVTNSTTVTAVDLWVTCNGGQTWESTKNTSLDHGTLKHEVDRDGTWGFYLVLKNDNGSSCPPPEPGTPPHIRVVVDTLAPTLQVHPTESPHSPTGGEMLSLRASLIDENLGTAGTRLFYRTTDATEWRDGGIIEIQDSHLRWQIPTSLHGKVGLRVVATDLAGNRSIEELPAATIAPAARAASENTDRPAAISSVPAPIWPLDGLVKPVEEASVKPVLPVELASDSTQPSLAESRQQDHLRELAKRFMEQQRYDLAAARFEEAVALAPLDANLQVDLGSALYWSNRYDDSAKRFQAALELSPDHTPALEGLALVAATQKRYPDARTHLQRLLELMPKSHKTWLRYGDIEHKLGNAAQACAAWEQVLELDGAEDTLRQKAEERLRYFGPARRRSQP
ncbi:MAG: tetratricopeptide repeat protein [Planctomycetota bacterium]